MMSVFLKKISLVLLIVFAASMILSLCSLWSLRRSAFYKPSFLVNAVSENNFDYIVIGASTGLTAINTQVIDSVLSTEGLNLSMDDTALSSQYLMLEHFIATGKQTKVCVLAASIHDYNTMHTSLSGNDYRFAPFVSRDYVQDYYASYSGRAAQVLSRSKRFPALAISYYNMELFYPSLVSLLDPNKRNRFDKYGNYSYPETSKLSEQLKLRKELKVTFKNTYVKRIQDLCTKHNIQLIVYLSPHKQIIALPIEKIPFVINHSATLNNGQYFYDDIHVNSLGRYEVSIQIAQDMKTILK